MHARSMMSSSTTIAEVFPCIDLELHGIKRSMCLQTCQHSRLVSVYGVKHVCFGANQLDREPNESATTAASNVAAEPIKGISWEAFQGLGRDCKEPLRRLERKRKKAEGGCGEEEEEEVTSAPVRRRRKKEKNRLQQRRKERKEREECQATTDAPSTRQRPVLRVLGIDQCPPGLRRKRKDDSKLRLLSIQS